MMIRKTALVLVALLVMAAAAAPAAAQGGACPGLTYEIQAPTGTYPANSKICVHPLEANNADVYDNDRVACGQAINSYPHHGPLIDDYYPDIFIAPDVDLYFGSPVLVMFWAWMGEYYNNDRVSLLSSPYAPGVAGDFLIDLTVYDVNGTQRVTHTFDVSDFMTVGGLRFYPQTRNYYPALVGVWLDDPTGALTNGYIQLSPRLNSDPNFYDYVFNIASIKMSRGNGELYPDPCSVPGVTGDPPLPNTPTPGPTSTAAPLPSATPTGTYTPPTFTPAPTASPTWPVGLPTAAGGTITPPIIPTSTPITFPTIPAEPTATPYTIPALAPIVFPTLSIPNVPAINTPAPLEITIEAAATVEAQSTDIWTWAGNVEDVAEEWAEPLEFSEQILGNWQGDEPTSTLQYNGAVITTTAVLSSPVQAVNNAMSYIVYPIRFIKSFRLYTPYSWPLVSFVFICITVMLFTVFLKFSITVIATIIEIIRRIWEAIPLN